MQGTTTQPKFDGSLSGDRSDFGMSGTGSQFNSTVRQQLQDLSIREPQLREQTVREQTIREQTLREQTIREQTIREQIVREQTPKKMQM